MATTDKSCQSKMEKPCSFDQMRRFSVGTLQNRRGVKKKRGEKSGSSDPPCKERVLMAEDWWLVSVLIPKDRLTSVITISSSSTQSRQSMASKWQRGLCDLRPWVLGKTEPASREWNVLRPGSFWLFILVWTKSEGTSVFLHGCGKSFFFFFFCSDCVLTPWNVSWKRTFRSGCQHRTRVFPAVVANGYYTLPRNPCSPSGSNDLKMAATHFQMSLFERWSGLKPPRTPCHRRFKLWRVWS